MRILHVINSINPSLGGTVECVRQIGMAMRSLDNSVDVVTTCDEASAPWLASFPLKVYPLGPALGNYGYSRKLRPWLQSNLKYYDVVIINGLWQYHGLAASREARKQNTKYVVYAHGMLDPWSRKAHPWKYVKKFIYWLIAENLTLSRACLVFFTSTEEQRLASSYFPISNWVSAVVGNGIAEPPLIPNSEIIEFRKRHAIPVEKRIWLFLSRIDPKKGIENLLTVLPSTMSLSDSPLVIVAGDGAPHYVEQLKRMAKEKGIEKNMRWTGPLYGDEKWKAYRSAELFVLPSHQENFGIVVAEALAVGLPVCTTTQVNIWREIEATKSGLICQDNSAALSAALSKWTALAQSEKIEMGQRARSCFEKYFRVADVAQRLTKNLGANWKARES